MIRARRLPLEVLLLPLMLVAGVAAHDANRWLEARRVPSIADGHVGALPDGKALRVASLGFARLVADLFWIRTTYYIGDSEASDAKWPDAERLANLVTDIDPRFDSVYVLMSSLLGTGLRNDPDAAIRLLEKGAAVSDYWRIHFLLGFQYFMEKQDYLRGAKCLERANELGGAPPYLQFLIARLYASAGDPTTGMQFIQARLMYEENDQVREGLEKRYSDLWINRDLALIDDAAARFASERHHAARSVRELYETHYLAEVPRDPKGGEYSISADGRAGTKLAYDKLELHSPGLRKLEVKVKAR